MKTSRKRISKLILALVFGIVIGYFISTYSHLFFQSQVEDQVKKFYELVYPESSVNIITLKEESGLYKVFLKIISQQSTSYQEVYISKDGKLLSIADSTILLESSIKQIEKSKNFVDCLFDKDVRIYGVLNQTENLQGAQLTLLQLNQLGRLYSSKLYISCDGDFVQQCSDKGIYQIPAIVVNNTIEVGIKTVDWFENKTGCRF